MAKARLSPVLKQLRSLTDARQYTGMTDAELVSAFVSRQDEAAFEAILRRHGPMVLRVARRVLTAADDAEDVFQATFLLLARKASTIRKRGSVASWLLGVAHRLALSARSQQARRSARERAAAAMRPREASADETWGELEGLLHEVIDRLPEKYRSVLVSCYL